MHDETSDASADSHLTHIHGHGCVLENDVSITTDTEELVGEAAEMVDIPVDSKIRYFLLLRRPVGDTLAPIQAMTQSESVLNQLWILMILLTVPMRIMKSFGFCFQSFLHLFLTLN
jgi:hypothetical protein